MIQQKQVVNTRLDCCFLHALHRQNPRAGPAEYSLPVAPAAACLDQAVCGREYLSEKVRKLARLSI
jgi:hypothetical protein